MENYGIFGQLATESADKQAAIEDNIVEEIAAEEAYADALAIESEIVAGVAAMSQAQVAADRVEAQVSHESMLLANPEQINVGCVALSQEALATTALLLGADASVLAPSVSQEAAEANPVSAMQISIENDKNFLTKVIDSIKAIFRKVMNAAKKLYVKLVVAMDGTAKKAKKLKKHIEKDLDGSTKTKNTFDEKKSEKLYKLLAIEHLDGLTIAGGTDKISTNTLDSLNKLLEDTTKVTEKEADKAPSDKGDNNTSNEAKPTDNAVNNVDNEKADVVKNKLSSSTMLDISKLEKAFNYSPAGEDTKFFATSYSNTKLHGIEVYKDDESYKIKTRTLMAETSNLPTSDLAVKELGTVGSELDSIINTAKGFKSTKDASMKFITAADKALDKIANSGSKLSYIANKIKAGQATLIRDITVTCALNVVLDEVKYTKAKLASANSHVGMYTNSSTTM